MFYHQYLERTRKGDRIETTLNRVKKDLSNLRGAEPTCNKYELHTISNSSKK